MTFPYRKALVTGAGSGMGRGLVNALHVRRVQAVGLARRASSCEGGPQILAGFDLSTPTSIERVAAEAMTLLGDLDLLIHCAGANVDDAFPREHSKGPLSMLGAKATNYLLSVNCVGPLLLTQHLIPYLRSVSIRPAVIFYGSQRGDVTSVSDIGSLAYSISKAALAMATAKLAFDPDLAHCTVSLYDPGWVRTRMGGADAPIDIEDATRRALAFLADTAANGRRQ